MKYPVIIEQTGPSSFCVHSPDVDGCFAAGDSLDDAITGFREALGYHFRALREAGVVIPRPTCLVEMVEVGEIV